MRGRSGWAKSSTGHAPLPIIFTRIACPLQFNKWIQFEPGNLSYHRVEAAGRNANVPSLIAPWTVSSVVTCTDCHDNDTGPNAPVPGTVPAGPHGSHRRKRGCVRALLQVPRPHADLPRRAASEVGEQRAMLLGMAIDAGRHVRHKTRAEWGIGKVEGTNGESVFVRFGDQLKTIKISFAEEFLQIVTADELVASKPAERAGPAVGRTALCPECGKALTRNANGEWRACPHCV